MSITELEILERRPYAEGRSFGKVGAYERIDAIAHYSVDPEAAENRMINDLHLAERGTDGQVHFTGDLTLLRPLDNAAGNRSLLLQLPNRGRFLATHINFSEKPNVASAKIQPGDGYLMEEGWSIAWVGWQWDVPREAERSRIGLIAPQVREQDRGEEERMQLRLQIDTDQACVPLTDQHVGNIGNHQPIPPLDTQDPEATLLVRDSIYGPAEIIDFDDWGFGRVEGEAIVADETQVWLRGGFKAGRIYDLLYHPRDCPVAGAGLLAIRDTALWLRHSPSAPTHGAIDHVIGEGISQCGRLWRSFLYLGLNGDREGRPAVDGILCHIAGARRGEFNHRHAQPSVQPTPSLGHLFPFSDDAQKDPLTGRHDGLLSRQAAQGAIPKIIYTDTSAEYWRGDAALTHTQLEKNADMEPPAHVRRYLFAGTQHSSGAPHLDERTMFGSRGSNLINILDYRPLYRSCLANLLAWVAEGKEPPGSAFPRQADHSRLSRSQALEQLSAIPGLSLPNEETLTVMRPLDLGSRAADGKPHLPATESGQCYPDWVSAVDEDGNERAGIAMPDVAVPLATYTGFNPRHAQTGASHLLLEYFGSCVPFARDPEEKTRTGDPRAAISERYKDRDDYLAQVRQAAEGLLAKKYLLIRDVDLCCEIAAKRYDAIMGYNPGMRPPRR